MLCPNCGEEAPDAARFCESCGVKLAVETASTEPLPTTSAGLPPCRCGAGPGEVDAQGFCTACGIRRVSGPKAASREPLPRDHVEIVLSPNFAGVTDRGKRHPCNEDDLALALEEKDGRPVYVIVVCDGVSSSQNADAASAAGVTAACEALRQAIQAGATDMEQAMLDAIQTAHKAVLTVPFAPEGVKDPPGATLVAALVCDDSAVIGWVGDSRAYRLDVNGAHPLTHDHSWINRVVDAGEMSEEEAEHAPEAHAITQCLGLMDVNEPDEAPEPSVTTVPLPSPCRLLVCTDGLWNYAPHPEQVAALVAEKATDGEALTLARGLIDFALEQGGRDNITAAILSL